MKYYLLLFLFTISLPLIVVGVVAGFIKRGIETGISLFEELFA